MHCSRAQTARIRRRIRANLLRMADEPRPLAPVPSGSDTLAEDEELPVVARMVVEIRSDGSRTIARGAAEDGLTGEKVALRIEGTTPLALALSLMKTMSQLPSLARAAVKAFKR